MFTKIVGLAGLALLLVHAPARADHLLGNGRQTAINACMGMHQFGSAETLEALEDGVGDWTVWIADNNGDRWMCNANGEGAVFVNVRAESDLLQGEGAGLLGYQSIRGAGAHGADPAEEAAHVCSAIGNMIEPMEVVGAVGDGFGAYVVWLSNTDDGLWLCDASGEGELHIFEPIGEPINGQQQQAAAVARFA